jgi:hypothetical protein
MQALFPGLQEAYLAPHALRREGSSPPDTLPIVVVSWKSAAYKQRSREEERLAAWLRKRMGQADLRVISAAP